jgi:hypothetical protein
MARSGGRVHLPGMVVRLKAKLLITVLYAGDSWREDNISRDIRELPGQQDN